MSGTFAKLAQRAGAVASCLLAITAVLSLVVPRWWWAGCTHETLSELESPDGTRVAVVQEHVCSDGAFTTALTSTVGIAWAGNVPARDEIIYSADWYSREAKPRGQWLSPEKLQITVPTTASIALFKSWYLGVEVALEFDPDDPAERLRWLRERDREN